VASRVPVPPVHLLNNKLNIQVRGTILGNKHQGRLFQTLDRHLFGQMGAYFVPIFVQMASKPLEIENTYLDVSCMKRKVEEEHCTIHIRRQTKTEETKEIKINLLLF